MDQPTYRPTHFEVPEDGIWPGNRDTAPYVFNDAVMIAADAALATGRPLLISGPPGSGKSTLAPTLAALKAWRFLPFTFTSRSRLEDLTGDIDHLRRLNDAQAAKTGEKLPPRWTYLQPGVLWWAFAPESAGTLGASPSELDAHKTSFTAPKPPGRAAEVAHAVVLLDEIDKAEPDLPNDLLDPLDLRLFQVPQGPQVAADAKLECLIVITTNGERELPPAFVRRCISLMLKEPDEEQLVGIAAKHFKRGSKVLHREVAKRVLELREKAVKLDRRPPSTSEYLDAIRACTALKVKPDAGNTVWQQISRATLAKDGYDDEETPEGWGTW